MNAPRDVVVFVDWRLDGRGFAVVDAVAAAPRLLTLELCPVFDAVVVVVAFPDAAAFVLPLPADDCSMSLSKSMIRSPMPPTSHSLSSYSKFDDACPLISAPTNAAGFTVLLLLLLLPRMLFDNPAVGAADLCGLLVFGAVAVLFGLLLWLAVRAVLLLLLLLLLLPLLLLLLVLSDFTLDVAT